MQQKKHRGSRYCKVSGHARKNILFIIDTSGSTVNDDRHATGNEAFQIEHFGYFCKSRSVPVTLIYAGRTNKTALKRSMLLASKLGAEYYQLEDLRSPEGSSY